MNTSGTREQVVNDLANVCELYFFVILTAHACTQFTYAAKLIEKLCKSQEREGKALV